MFIILKKSVVSKVSHHRIWVGATHAIEPYEIVEHTLCVSIFFFKHIHWDALFGPLKKNRDLAFRILPDTPTVTAISRGLSHSWALCLSFFGVGAAMAVLDTFNIMLVGRLLKARSGAELAKYDAQHALSQFRCNWSSRCFCWLVSQDCLAEKVVYAFEGYYLVLI